MAVRIAWALQAFNKPPQFNPTQFKPTQIKERPAVTNHMNFFRSLAAVAATGLAMIVAATSAHAQSSPNQLSPGKQLLLANPALEYDPYSVLVRFTPDSTNEQRSEALAAVGGTVLKAYDLVPGLFHISIEGTADQAVAALGAFKAVQYAELDYVRRTDAIVPNDPFFSLEWGMLNTGQTVNLDPGTAGADARMPDAWTVLTGNANFVVAIIDSGTLLAHEDLAANIWTNPGEIAANGIDDDANGYIDDTRGWDFFSVDNDPSDVGHGTHTAGTVGAVGNNGVGVAGVAWNCKLMALRFIGPNGGFTSDAVLAVQYATRKQVKVSNNSWGGGGFDQSLFDAISASAAVGHVFVASAGNGNAAGVGINNDITPSYPASYALDNIISVAATDNDDRKATFSNFGAVSVDIGAPGVNIASTYGAVNGYAYLSGTSMAGPHVAGLAALLYIQNPTWTLQQVKARILGTARPIAALSGLCVSGGVMNAAAALGAATSTNTAPTVTITAPGAGASFAFGATVTFTGTATDLQDGVLTASITWTDSVSGALGTGGSVSRSNLSIGSHVITARVTDAGGLSTAVTRTINITAPPVPAQPTGVRTTAGPARATITWTDRSTNETGFEVRREQRVNGAWINTTTVGSVAANVTSFINTGLTSGGQYRYSVRSINGPSASAWTGWVTVTAQ